MLRENPDGTLTLTRCCQVGGLGGTPYRDGSFEYYIGEKMRDNDAKATGPKFVENVVQAISRDLLMNAMKTLSHCFFYSQCADPQFF